ncbi:MAG: hypothetical protein ACR65U_01725 [Methylocystis sp.]
MRLNDNILKIVATRNAGAEAAVARSAGFGQSARCDEDGRRSEMDEFGGGFMRNMMIGFALALAFSIIYVWYTR